MQHLFLSPSLVVEFLLNGVIFFLMSVAFVATLPFLSQRYKISQSFTYSVQKNTHLVATLLTLVLFFKLLLLPFFLYNLDKLSLFLSGAMCAAGVVSANSYGGVLVVVKLTTPLLLMLYALLYKESQMQKSHYLSRKRHILFIGVYMLVVIEMILSYLYYTHIPLNQTLSCCSTLYTNSSVHNRSTLSLLLPFYGVYGAIVFFTLQRKRVVVALLSLVFLYTSYEAITYFFSSYIYELPSHKCPYCILGSDYNYVGYLIYALLFFATFYALKDAFFKEETSYKRVLFFYTSFVFVLCYFFIHYLIKNGTFLW